MQLLRNGLGSVLLFAGSQTVLADDARNGPLNKVFELINELEAKIIADGEKADADYHTYFEWCDETAANSGNAIKNSKKEKEKLEAKIVELKSDIEEAVTSIEELAASIGTADKELKAATKIREKDLAVFVASETELMEAVDAMGRAIGVLEKEMAKGSALAQVDTTSVTNLLQGMSVILEAASFSSDDQKKLMALVQSQASSDADDEELSAPAAAATQSKSGGILDVLQDMKEKAEVQLAGVRKAEVAGKHNYEMLKQSLEDKMGADTKDMKGEKAAKAAAEEGKAAAEGDLEQTIKELTSSDTELATVKSTCIKVAADHEATVAARKEELEVIAEAEKILKETTGEADGASSFVQVSAEASSVSVGRKVVSAVKRLAKQQHSSALAQLASRIASVLRFRGAGDPFAKVRGLIQDMIAKLEKQGEAAATEKAYCDEQMSKTGAKQGDLQDDIEAMTTKIDQATAKTAELKEQVKETEAELADINKEQAEMDKVRQAANTDYQKTKGDLETGLGGVRKALDVLREYYDSGSAAMVQDDKFSAFMQQPAPPQKFQKAGGAGGSIVSILEVVESDFAKSLAKVEAEEADAQAEYEKVTQENEVVKATKEQDVKYKNKEIKSLAATLSELSADRETSNTELAAVNDYFGKIKDRCIAKPESFEERTKRRAAEIQGLKEALTILNDVALVQRKKHGSFRGTLAAQ